MARHAASDGVYEKLKQEIIHLELPPGTMVSEIDTAEKYGVSRTPVRDAFKTLEKDGLLTVRPHVGSFVSKINLKEISDILFMREVLDREVLTELVKLYDPSLEYRIQLILQKQKDMIDKCDEYPDIGKQFLILDNEYHMELYDMTGKRNVAKMLYSMNAQYERFRTFVNYREKSDLSNLYRDHVKIWECITKGDVAELRECVKHHIYDGFNSHLPEIASYPDYFCE